jgi:serine/threonine-protein kinase
VRGRRADLLLTPQDDPDVLRRAAALVDRAVAADRARHTGYRAYFRAAQGLAEHRAGRHEAAVTTMEGDAAGALGPVPQLVVAMARASLGRPTEARRALARAAASADWSPAGATSADAWMYHVLRREAEALALPDLPAFLAGTYEPRENDERVATAAACQFLGRHAARARLWDAVLAADPEGWGALGGRTRRPRRHRPGAAWVPTPTP